jgi:hypothetical protein
MKRTGKMEKLFHSFSAEASGAKKKVRENFKARNPAADLFRTLFFSRYIMLCARQQQTKMFSFPFPLLVRKAIFAFKYQFRLFFYFPPGKERR